MSIGSRSFWLALAIVPWMCVPASAITIKMTDPKPHLSDREKPCPPHLRCSVSAGFSSTPVSGDSDFFARAFEAWNAQQPPDAQWMLIDGGGLDATLNIEIFDAHSYHKKTKVGDRVYKHVGGVEIQIDFMYDGNDRDDFLWSQALYLNYKPHDTTIHKPFRTMDDAALSQLTCDPMAKKAIFNVEDPNVWCGPVYPYQYTDEVFYDFPKAPYETGSFTSNVFLSKVDYSKDQLTIYEGFSYFFSLSAVPRVVPEPPPIFFFVVGLLGICVLRYTTINTHVKH